MTRQEQGKDLATPAPGEAPKLSLREEAEKMGRVEFDDAKAADNMTDAVERARARQAAQQQGS